jgi:hypothetical protein
VSAGAPGYCQKTDIEDSDPLLDPGVTVNKALASGATVDLLSDINFCAG